MDATEPLLRELVGAALREERRRQGLTLARLAAASGVSMQHLSDVERGQKDPSSEVLAAITGALGLSVYEIGRRVADVALPALRGLAGPSEPRPMHRPRAAAVLDLTAHPRDSTESVRGARTLRPAQTAQSAARPAEASLLVA